MRTGRMISGTVGALAGPAITCMVLGEYVKNSPVTGYWSRVNPRTLFALIEELSNHPDDHIPIISLLVISAILGGLISSRHASS